VSCPHTHHQNGTTKRKHQHIVKNGLTSLTHASVPFPYWSDAFLMACFLINRMPSRVIEMQSPVDQLLGETHDYTFFKVFGWARWPHTCPYNSRKLEFRSVKCVLPGHSYLHKGLKCLHIPTNRICISRDVVFDERVFPFANTSPSTFTPPKSSSSPIVPLADQFYDYVHAPLLLADHVVANLHEAWMELLPNTSDIHLHDHVDRMHASLPVHGSPCPTL
jgi:histone deacetylase 1/2